MLRSGLILFAAVLAFYPSWHSPIAALHADDLASAEQLDFFENKIRPLLSNHCLECHGADKSESELRLDSRDAILKGGSSGDPGAVAGQPDASLMIQSVRHAGDYDMPPNKKLSEQEISDLANWIDMGMPWPKSTVAISKATMPELIRQHQQNHWAFQPIRRPTIPVATTSAGKNSTSQLDDFVQAKLSARKLSSSPRADRRTLIRRATFDLTGLPPTFDEVDTFVNDDAPDAYAKLIDRLLDSPHYGERWARHWLDVARYADTSGYTFDNGDRRYPFAFTYRDYVIDAFNNDLPYDQFIRQQLAADHLPVPDDNKTLAALGYITVGRKYIDRNDTIDDQVDVVTRGLMGLTVSCARCHDHKYDAIPTQDYYSLFGVFRNSEVPDELPLIGDPKEQAQFKSFFEKLDQLKNDIDAYQVSKHEEILLHVRETFTDYLARIVAPNQESLITQQSFVKLKESDLRPAVLDRWRQFLAKRSTTNTALLKPTLDMIGIPDKSFAEGSAQLIEHWSTLSDGEINPLLLAKMESSPPKSKLELARILGELFSETYESWKKSGSKRPIVDQFQGPQREIAALFFDSESPANFAQDQVKHFFNQGEGNQLRKLRAEVNKHNADSPAGLARAMVLRDKHPLKKQRVMIRGKGDGGKVAPRRFVAVLSKPDDRPVFVNKSGRLELADRIASPDNPLTARVFVNRVWMHHFSDPLVDTPSDFGVRCPEPVQRDVLDFLAADFMENGWSIKHLHRQIMLSDTYCQSSINRPDCAEVDPENRLYWKMNRRRLEFEPLRDSILSVAGSLDPQRYGKPVDLFQRPFVKRRTIYGFLDRQDLPNLFRVFDLSNPDQSAAKRIRTSVPQQSLYMMNSRFVIEQARTLVNSIPDFANIDGKARICALYRKVLQRDPDKSELEIGLEFIKDATPKTGEKNLGPWQRYAQLLLFTNEFEFID